MIKKNDVVRTPRGQVGIVKGFCRDGIQRFALVKLMGEPPSWSPLAVPVESLRRHLWLND